ncbi:MAG: hypothetical protein J6S75_05425 [Thermoguttaceae bacterium]|nr:hypothetical protein [Thermoguttaceae bacterium]
MRHPRTFVAFALALAALLFSGSGARATVPFLKKTEKILFDTESGAAETTPFLWKGRELLLGSVHKPDAATHGEQLVLIIADARTGEIVSRFGECYSMSCAFAEGDTLHVFAAKMPETENWDNDSLHYWFTDIVHFKTTDLKNWTLTPAVSRDNEHLLNSSVCRDGDGYLMLYETDTPVQFCFKFARSADLEHWEKVPDSLYAGPDGKSYCGGPVVRRSGDYYYVIYLREDGRGGYESVVIRSKDLRRWEASPLNPIFTACEGEGINNSDIDLCEIDGKTVFCYAIGNQIGWYDVREAVYDGTADQFFAECFPDDSEK